MTENLSNKIKMKYIGAILGLYWDNGKENGNYRDYRVYIGVILAFRGLGCRVLRCNEGRGKEI